MLRRGFGRGRRAQVELLAHGWALRAPFSGPASFTSLSIASIAFLRSAVSCCNVDVLEVKGCRGVWSGEACDDIDLGRSADLVVGVRVEWCTLLLPGT